MRFHLLILLACAPQICASELAAPAAARQCVFVATRGWSDTSGTLRRFSRSSSREPWRAAGPAISVNVGRSGLAWGLGLHTVPSDGPRKVEGDGKAPAGVFRLTAAFGYDEKPAGVSLPYIRGGPDIAAIDDPHSRYYNRIVDRTRIAKPDWNSSEKMRPDSEDYRLGIVVAHNPRAVPRAGSCIFMHLWRGPGRGSAGCTTMPRDAIAELQRWLRPAAHPVLIQAPREFLPVSLR